MQKNKGNEEADKPVLANYTYSNLTLKSWKVHITVVGNVRLSNLCIGHTRLTHIYSMSRNNKIQRIITTLLEKTNQQQHVLVDGNFSQFKPKVLGVPQGSVLGLLLIILHTAC